MNNNILYGKHGKWKMSIMHQKQEMKSVLGKIIVFSECFALKRSLIRKKQK